MTNKLQILLVASVCVLSSCRTDHSYSVRNSQKYGQYVAVFADGSQLAKITPKYRKEIAAISIFKDDSTVIEPIYSSLVDRADISQPKPFDDITGDGKPDLVCIERQSGLVNHGPYPVAIRIFTIDGTEVIEHKPLIIRIGEALHFDDFNKDGILEFVNTDNERNFKYRKDGLPDSEYVYSWDNQAKQYKTTTKRTE